MSRFMLNLRRAVFNRDAVQIAGQTRSSMMENLGEWIEDDDDNKVYDDCVDAYGLETLQAAGPVFSGGIRDVSMVRDEAASLMLVRATSLNSIIVDTRSHLRRSSKQ